MKKYSDKFLNQTNKLKKALVGIEFEFYIKDLSFYKTLEMLNDELAPVKVWGFRQYHSNFTPDRNNFKIEPDLSGGSNMIELVTGPLPYFEAKYHLVKILNFVQKYGYTNEKSSIHLNISFDDDSLDLSDINILKVILNTDEDEIFNSYPSRKNNVYAKSIKKIIPYKEYDFFNIPISVVKNNIRVPSDKYYGINFTNINSAKEKQRLEFRYIGGQDYEKNVGQIIYFMDRFIINVYNSIREEFTHQEISKLEDFLQENIKRYKNFSKYDNFIVTFPSVIVQVDQVSNYEIVSSYYDKIYHKIYSIIDSVEDLKDCIINYYTQRQVLEIVDADIKGMSPIKTIDFINCNLEGIFEDCFFLNSGISNSQITKSMIKYSEANNTKIFNSNVEESTLKNCYFMEGYLNSDMLGGVYRSGKLGPRAFLDSDVKMVGDYDNFFSTKFDPDEDKGLDKYSMKNFGKIEIKGTGN